MEQVEVLCSHCGRLVPWRACPTVRNSKGCVGWDMPLPTTLVGAKLLPREPTSEMLAAVRRRPHVTRPDGWDDRHTVIWRAMWDAYRSI